MTDHISILKNYLKSLERKKLLADTFLYDKEQINKEIEAFKAAIRALEKEDKTE